VVVLEEDGVSLGLAHLLEDHLLGHLRGDAAERGGVLIEAQLSAHLNLGRELARLIQRHLVDLVLDLLRRLDDGLEDVGANLARLLVHLRAHVLLGLVVLARRQGDRILNRAHHDRGLNALVPAQHLNRLIQNARHLFPLLARKSTDSEFPRGLKPRIVCRPVRTG
jgi:hypothetical protein